MAEVSEANIFENVKPFTGDMPVPVQEPTTALAEVAIQREIAEVQAAMAIAKKFPRNQQKALDKILIACQRPSLAEKALYSYARGGTDISGASIRLAETLAQLWGNIQFGIRELEQRLGESTVETYAWDLETNTRQNKTFQVKHIRKARGQYTSLDDPRDIYEMTANQGARRLRACILGVIPVDIVDAAVEQCEATLKAKVDVGPDGIKKMLEKFAEYGVNKAMIEHRIQRNLDSITAAQVISLRKIYNSLRDGMSQPENWFELVEEKDKAQTKAQTKTKRGRPKKQEPEVQEKPESQIVTSPEPREGTIEEQPLPDPSVYSPEKPYQRIQGSQLAILSQLCKSRDYPMDALCQDYELDGIEQASQEQFANMEKFLRSLPLPSSSQQ